MQHEFEIRDTVGVHLRVKKSEAPKVGIGALIKVAREEIPVTLRNVQTLKTTEEFVALWFFVIKGQGGAGKLIAHRGEKATLTYPVELTKEQLGLTTKKSEPEPAKPPVKSKPSPKPKTKKGK